MSSEVDAVGIDVSLEWSGRVTEAHTLQHLTVSQVSTWHRGLVGNCRMQHRYAGTGVTHVSDGTQQNGADGLRVFLTRKRIL